MAHERLIALQFAIYMATIDYMIASYGPYSASATGGNALARDFLAGVAAMYSVPCRPSPSPRLPLCGACGQCIITVTDYPSLRVHWHQIQARMAHHHPCMPCLLGHDAHLHLLLAGPANPKTIQVRPNCRERPQGQRGGSESKHPTRGRIKEPGSSRASSFGRRAGDHAGMIVVRSPCWLPFGIDLYFG
jgi:hypothetical protein